MTPHAAYLRLGSSLVALAAGTAGLVVVVLLLRGEPGPLATTPSIVSPAAPASSTSVAGGTIPTPNQPGFPSPPPGAVVLAREAGSYALALAVVPGTPRSLVRVSVVSPAGPGARGLDVAVVVGGGVAERLAACGAGCYQASLATVGVRLVTVRLGAGSYRFELPSARQPPNGTAIVARATNVWRGLRTLVWHERLASSPTEVIHTVYEAVAPDKLSYTITGLSSAIIIGNTRWDRSTPSGPWLRSAQDPAISVPVPFWVDADDARVLGSSSVSGRAVWTVSFFDPVTPAWFQAEIDKANGRTLELSMIAASHFMHHVYGPFNAGVQLQPPGKRQ